jgi:hypothetical protein
MAPLHQVKTIRCHVFGEKPHAAGVVGVLKYEPEALAKVPEKQSLFDCVNVWTET